MAAGHTIILLQRSKRDNIDHQKSSSEPTIIPPQTYGPSHAQFLKWLQVISYSNQEREIIMTRMMIIWPRWWNYWEECQKTWRCQVKIRESSLIVRDIWGEYQVSISGPWRKCSLRSTASKKKRHAHSPISYYPCWAGTMKQGHLPRRCSSTHG